MDWVILFTPLFIKFITFIRRNSINNIFNTLSSLDEFYVNFTGLQLMENVSIHMLNSSNIQFR